MQAKLALLLSLAAGAHACLRQWDERHYSHAHHAVKRQAAAFPPVLTAHESVLVNSFDNNSISDWS